jgi:predicted RNA-binding Zn-ribbon protein involved in translation (DUF1610 family)
VFNVRVRRGDRISDHSCPGCGDVPLQGVTAGAGHGRYLCPITGFVVTLGQTGVRLEQPYRLVFAPGVQWPHGPNAYFHRTEPDRYEQRSLDLVAGRVLGTGCVVGDRHDPHRPDHAEGGFHADRLARAGLRLVPAQDHGDPTDWIVNQVLVYRRCVACGSRTPDLPDRRSPDEWKPRQTHVRQGRGARGRTLVEVDPGPHPAGSLACTDCDPRAIDAKARV